MTKSGKDSNEVVEFMTLFSRLKLWCDDAPEGLGDLAKDDSSVEDLCTQLSSSARCLKMNERRHQAYFVAPVDPTFLAAWRDYEKRYESVLSDVWFPFPPLPGLDAGDSSRALRADLKWDNVDYEADEQARAIEEVIEFANFNADLDLREFPEEFVERIQDGIAAWGSLKRDTGFEAAARRPFQNPASGLSVFRR